MRKINCIIVAMTAIAMFFSCVKNGQGIDDTVEPAEKVTISATLSEALTKVDFAPSFTDGKPTHMALAWAHGDKIRVYNHSDHTQYQDFTLDSAYEGQKTGVFTGTAIAATLYDVEVINDSFDYNSQKQPSDGVTTGLKYMACAESIADYSDIEFTSFSSVLAITAKMRSTDVAAVIESVDITASEAVFNGKNSLSITFGTVGDKDGDGILHFFATLPVGTQGIDAGTTLLIHFNAPGQSHDVYTRFVELPATSFTENKLNTVNVNASESDTHAGLTSCDGSTSEKAYLIGDKYQMNALVSKLTLSKTYVKLVDDIDMSSFGESLTTSADKKVDFNGNGKKVMKLDKPMFSALFGSVYDLTIKDANVSINSNDKGILANIAGSASVTGDTVAEEITIINSKISNNNQRTGALIGRLWGTVKAVTTDSKCSVTGGGAQTGGLIGRIDAGSIEYCSTAGTVASSSYYQGGLVGMVEGGNIEQCSSSATITNSGDNYAHAGGLIGTIEGGSVEKSHAGGNISAIASIVGGLVGSITAGTVSISKCYATGNVTETNATQAKLNYGGLVGKIDGTSVVTITDCYSTGSVSAAKYSGGFIGGIGADASATVKNGYTTSAVSGAKWNCCVFMGALDGTLTSCTGFVGWNTSSRAAWYYNQTTAPTGNYMGTDDSVYKQAVALGGWDFVNVWTTDAEPKLK